MGINHTVASNLIYFYFLEFAVLQIICTRYCLYVLVYFLRNCHFYVQIKGLQPLTTQLEVECAQDVFDSQPHATSMRVVLTLDTPSPPHDQTPPSFSPASSPPPPSPGSLSSSHSDSPALAPYLFPPRDSRFSNR